MTIHRITMGCLLVLTNGLLPRLASAAPVPPLVEGTRQVLAAIVRAGEDNARKTGRQRLKGDELTVHYIRAAAEAARVLPREQAAGSFLLGLGLGLDDSTIVRSNPLTFQLCRQAESNDERRVRLKVLGSPTMRTRRDWTQHFVVSCALTEIVGEQLAEAAGILKEQLDAQPGGSGFSFGDLNADLAGVAFAVRVKKGTIGLKGLASGFTVNDFLPDAADLREGLSAETFAKDYGSVSDHRFKAEVDLIRKRIQALPGYKP
jgi:hypothetical protein